jgi:hypothetical protein
MIELNHVRLPSEHILRRSRLMLVRRLAVNEFKVTPKQRGRAIRIVRFTKRGQWEVTCESYRDGTPCEANSFHNLCAHVYAVVRALEIQETRRRNRKQSIAA